MGKTNVYPTIWAVAPYTYDVMSHRATNDKVYKELILKNSSVEKLGISEMDLNITKFSAIDKAGNEHHITDFPGQDSVQIKGMGSGHFLKSTNMISLAPGTYTSLRFYLGKTNNRFIYKDGVAETANEVNSLDFKMEKNLVIGEGEKTEVKLWFDFAPYQFSCHFKPLTDWFKKSNIQKPRLANNLG